MKFVRLGLKGWRKTMRWLGAIVFLALYLGMPVLAQDQGGSVIRVDVNLVLIDATVKTKAGAIMGELKQDAFEVREDGVAQKIEIFSRDELPLNVALVLDLSDRSGHSWDRYVTPRIRLWPR